MRHAEVLRSHEARQRREARELFDRHELVRVDGVRAAFAEPGMPCNAFEITCLGWGQVVVSGDIEAVVFDRSDGDDVFQRAAWLAGCDGHKARQRARMATRQEYREFVPAALAQILLNREASAPGADVHAAVGAFVARVTAARLRHGGPGRQTTSPPGRGAGPAEGGAA